MNVITFLHKKGIDTLDQSFYSKIFEWKSWYEADVPSFHRYRIYTGNGNYIRCRRQSLKMAKTVCEDMANFLLNERVKYTVEGNANYDFIASVLRVAHWSVLGNTYQELKAALGTVAYIPYLDDIAVDEDGNIIPGTGSVKIDYVMAPNIYPVSWDNGRITECVFAFRKAFRLKKYVHLQYHHIDPETGLYVIENTVTDCSASWRELTPDEWKRIPAFATLAPVSETGSPLPQFVIDKLNIVNNADADNPMGISIFANAEDVLQKLDLEYDSYANEFNLGRKRIFVSPEMLSGKDGNYAFDPRDTVFYRLPEDYFANTHEAIHESNMALRVNEHKMAIQDDLGYLSTKCGFGQQHYKYETGGVKTATEVVSENSDLYRTICKHELILDEVLKDLFRIILRLGVVIGAPGLNPDAQITIDFDDSIIEDKTAERAQDKGDIAIGVMRRDEYRAKWYAETEEQAAERLPDTNSGVID